MLDRDAGPSFDEDLEVSVIALGLRQRNAALLHVLVKRYQQHLVRYLIYLLARREGVDDIVQETWLRVLERGSTFDGLSRFEPWLFTIARNLAFDRERIRRTISLDDEEVAFHGSAITSESPSPFVLAARSQDAARLAATMHQLPFLYREVLVLRFQDDLSLQEISTVVDAPVSTVASRIYRGLAILRTQLGDTR